jgi:hypothetical protein
MIQMALPATSHVCVGLISNDSIFGAKFTIIQKQRIKE